MLHLGSAQNEASPDGAWIRGRKEEIKFSDACSLPDLPAPSESMLAGTPVRTSAGNDSEPIHKTHDGVCLSAPLLGSHGKLMGMISAHFRRPHCPRETELRFLMFCGEQAVHLIAHQQAERELCYGRPANAAKWRLSAAERKRDSFKSGS